MKVNQILKVLDSHTLQCTDCKRCSLGYGATTRPSSYHSLYVNAKLNPVLIVGQAPDLIQNSTGLIETGPFGTLLDRLLFEANIKHFVVTNAVICAPFTDEQKSRTRNPIPEEISACSPNLTLLLQKLEPPAIMLFGKEAVKSYELIMKKHPTKTPMFKFPSLFNIRSANTVEYRRVYLQLLEVRNAIGL